MYLAIENPLNSSELVFPTLECIHIVGFAILVGTIAIVDFRILGLGMRQQKVPELAKSTAPWTLTGLVLALFSGPLLFSSDPDMYYLNISFQLKMVFLLAAIIFHYTIHRKVALSGGAGAGAKAVACISMLLWCCVIYGGIFIAFV
ncbi:MAG TPA: DUF6644 family protein [Bryobacteraceae bacterium]|nr:DUF6644 family protein [Bryobacteraceae bacterium]